MVAIRAGAREVPVLKPADVRFGSKADIEALPLDVRFTPESGHAPTRSGCLLWADFVAEVGDDRCVAIGANFFK
jgi:hypothetical protein